MDPVLEEARAACEERRWGDAHRRFSEVDADNLAIEDLDSFATAAYLVGADEKAFALWTKAHQRCLDDGAIHRAAYFGARLGQCLGFKGDMPRCGGWVDRVARLLSDAEIDCVEQGLLEYGLGMLRLFEAGDVPGALDRFQLAGKIASRFRSAELATLSRIAEGRMLIYLGDVGRGVALLDEAVVSIEAGELSTIATGDAYCTVIDACAELSDIARCRSLTTSMMRWCDAQQELVLYRGHCFIHAAQVLEVLGRWVEALSAARSACDRLAGPVPAAVGAAACLEGDLLRQLGQLDDAERAYARANDLGYQPQPGLALLRLEQGRIDECHAMIRRAVGEAEGAIERSRLLPAQLDIVLATGDLTTARSIADELRAVATELRSPMLRANAERGIGAVHLRSGDPSQALLELRRAADRFRDLDAQVEFARTRLLVAEACHELGDEGTAELETAAARAVLAASRSSVQEAALAGSSDEPPDGLTRRELEVLLLLARGKTNRGIGDELFISEKTVASHVSHIFTKLGVTSRSAATAYAHERDLV